MHAQNKCACAKSKNGKKQQNDYPLLGLDTCILGCQKVQATPRGKIYVKNSSFLRLDLEVFGGQKGSGEEIGVCFWVCTTVGWGKFSFSLGKIYPTGGGFHHPDEER